MFIYYFEVTPKEERCICESVFVNKEKSGHKIILGLSLVD